MFCPNCGSKLEEDANFCTNCGYKIGSPMTEEQPKANATANSAPDAQTNFNAQANANANVQFNQTSRPKRDPNQPLIDNEKLPEGIRNMPAQKFNTLAIWSAVVGLVLGLISLVFLIPVNTDIGSLPLIMGTAKGAVAIYIVFLLLFIAGLIMTVITEGLGGLHFARKADYKGLPVVLIANFVEFIMMFFMIPTLSFFSKVSSVLMRGANSYYSDDLLGITQALVDGYSATANIPSIAAGIVMIVISIAVIVVIARFTAPDPVKESAEPTDF